MAAGRGSSIQAVPGLRTVGVRHGECLGERGHEPEAGGVVLDGDLALAGTAGEPAGAAQEVIGQAFRSTPLWVRRQYWFVPCVAAGRVPRGP
ncbi:hypothetical protein GCM10009734_24920 [Nonomuraea bangladeshensis]